MSAPESAERDATAGSTVSLSIPTGQATPPPPPRGDVPSFSLSLSSPNVGDPSRIAEFVPDRAAATPELYPKFPRKPSGNPVRFRFWDFQGGPFFDVGTACLRSAAWPPDPPRSSARIRARARADPADPAVGIAPELAALDRELAAVGGVARGDADDIYACGPPAVVFEAVARFAEAVERELGLVMRPEKLLCFSHSLDLATCPERVAHRVPVGILRDEADEPLLVPCGRGGEPEGA